jgi:polar amino acid transport system substrate-binding protein
MVIAACTPGGTTKVRVATDATWPPFEMVDESTKEIIGYDIDLMKAVAKEAGLEIEFVNVGFDPLLAGIAQCQYDAAISAMTITEDRKKDMLFSEPYLNAGQVVAVQTGNTTIKSKDDLTGKTVGAQIGTTGAIEVGNIAGATLKTYDTLDLAFLDLMNGQIDAVVSDYPTAMAFVGKNSEKLMTVGQAFTEESYGIAVCKNKPDLLTKINEGLVKVQNSDLPKQLEDKWLKTQ